MPPALAKDLAYSSLRNERHTPAPPAPPNGPSPSMPVNIWPNIDPRNDASNSVALMRACALTSNAGTVPGALNPLPNPPPASARSRASSTRFAGEGREGDLLPNVRAESEAAAVWPASAGMVDISHHLDVGLDGAVGLHRLQDGDHVEHADAERVEGIDQLLQRHALVDDGELLAVLLHADLGARNHHGA